MLYSVEYRSQRICKSLPPVFYSHFMQHPIFFFSYIALISWKIGCSEKSVTCYGTATLNLREFDLLFHLGVGILTHLHVCRRRLLSQGIFCTKLELAQFIMKLLAAVLHHCLTFPRTSRWPPFCCSKLMSISRYCLGLEQMMHSNTQKHNEVN